MYQIGDYLVYGSEGVCRVENIGSPKLTGVSREKLYYTLAPCSGGGVIYTPVDTAVHMRAPMEAAVLEELIEKLPELPLCGELPREPRLLSSFYQQILHTHDCVKILQLYKTLYVKQRALMGSRKSLNATDQRYWKQAEDLLCSEICFVLGLDRLQVVRLLKQKIGENA